MLRGIFTLRRSELAWYYQDGASHLFPDRWEEFVAPIPVAERHDFITAYRKRLVNDNDKAEQLKCAEAWMQWENIFDNSRQRAWFDTRRALQR